MVKRTAVLTRIILSICTAAAGGSGVSPAAGGGEDFASVVGSSTVYPFARAVASRLETEGVPVDVRPTGTSGGIQFFCSGRGAGYPSAVMASRPITDSERSACADAGTPKIVERIIGRSGIVLARAARTRSLELKRSDIFLAVAASVPASATDCRLVQNPARTWSDIRADLPDEPIIVLGPPLSSGTRASVLDLIFEPGSKEIPCLARLAKEDPDAFDAAIRTLRVDGGWVDAGENDPAIIAAVLRMRGAVGIFGYAHFADQRSRLKAARIDGVDPTDATILSGAYPLARVLRIYARPSAVEGQGPTERFLDEFRADRAIGEDGYLRKMALIPATRDR